MAFYDDLQNFLLPIMDPADVLGGQGVKDAQAQQQQQYQQNMEMLRSYRPVALQAREMGLGHSLQAFNPANEYLKRMYGADMGLDLQALGNPGIAEYLSGGMPAAGQVQEPINVEGSPSAANANRNTALSYAARPKAVGGLGYAANTRPVDLYPRK